MAGGTRFSFALRVQSSPRSGAAEHTATQLTDGIRISVLQDLVTAQHETRMWNRAWSGSRETCSRGSNHGIAGNIAGITIRTGDPDMAIKDWPSGEGPREKLAARGAGALSE